MSCPYRFTQCAHYLTLANRSSPSLADWIETSYCNTEFKKCCRFWAAQIGELDHAPRLSPWAEEACQWT